MHKEEFLKQLELLLFNIPKEEREEALTFYRNYFDDAGIENEQTVINELKSPECVAKTITQQMQMDKGEYTETGYQTESEEKSSIIKIQQTTQNRQEETTNKQQETTNRQQVKTSQGIHIILLAIILIFALPVIFPVFITVVAVAVGCTIGFGAAGVGCIAGGLIAFINGVIKLGLVPWFGISAVGAGLVCFGLGILFIYLSSKCFKLFPIAIRGLVSIFKTPFQTGRKCA